MKVEPYLIASTVNIAISQRLLRKICEHCKTEKQMTPAEEKSLREIMPADLVAEHAHFFYGKGCDECGGTGYRGRVGIHEVIVVDGPIRDAILRKASASELRDIAIAHGMKPIVVDGFYKAAAGKTTIEEVLRMRYE
jgi:type IV pilus assembly protein PilB